MSDSPRFVGMAAVLVYDLPRRRRLYLERLFKLFDAELSTVQPPPAGKQFVRESDYDLNSCHDGLCRALMPLDTVVRLTSSCCDASIAGHPPELQQPCSGCRCGSM